MPCVPGCGQGRGEVVLSVWRACVADPLTFKCPKTVTKYIERGPEIETGFWLQFWTTLVRNGEFH